jgi:hypothetical protein
MRERLARLAVVCASLLAFATPSAAQVYTGRIDITVTDSTGAILPGVAVDISGPQGASAVSDAKGEVHFLNLAPGTYTVAAKLQGFGDYTNKNVPVAAGAGVPLKIALAVGAVTQSVDVSAESPVIDPKRTRTGATVTHEELQQIPSSRDPWVVLQTVPGVIVDRVNVGGAESGQQSNYQAKGAASGDNTWNIDGVAITDMAALGSSPTYYDFDMFEQMQVTTGGADLQSATPGVGLNFVLKAGTNTPRGSSRIYYEDEDMQANNLPDDLKSSLGGVTGKGNRINRYKDWGGELGGPIWKDRLWAWGAYGKTDVTLLTLANTPDRTILKDTSFKGTGQVTEGLRGNFTFFRGDKLKYGRSASSTRPPETTVDQSGPTSVYKGEGNLVISNNLFVTARYAYVSGGFQLTPQGGLDTPYYIDDAGITRGSFTHYETIRPSWTSSADGNFFKGRHEVKFGFGWRRADVDSTTIVPGYDGPNGIITTHQGYPTMKADVFVANDSTSSKGVYTNAYIGDTMTWDRLTLNVGLRWDRQAGSVNGNTQTGSALLPALLPDLTSKARNDVIVWNSITPRLGLTYALDETRRTIARASYGSFASQLSATAGNFMSVVGGRGVYLYDVIDLNGNRVIDAAEIAGRTCNDTLVAAGACDYYGFDINNPGNVGEPVHTVGDYKTPMTHEFQLGVDRELVPNFGVSGTFTYRKFTNFTWRNNGLVGSAYTEIGNLVGTHPAIGDYSVPVFGVTAAQFPANRSATIYRERPDYSQRYVGFELAATKRLSNRWMARLGFSTNQHREYFDSREGMTDPTPSPTNPNVDGGLVVRSSTGSGKSGIFQVLPTYQFTGTGLYQAKWGINLAANIVSRQGFAMQYNRTSVDTRTISAAGDANARTKTVFLLDEAGDERLPGVTSLDVRVGKEFALKRTRFNLDVDLFNALNSATILGRQYDLRVTTANNVLEIMNPRVLRLGLRFAF